jgi:hypothetical protein
MKTDLRFPSGGFASDLSRPARAALFKLINNDSAVAAVGRAKLFYMVERNTKHPTPQKARATLKATRKKIVALHTALLAESFRPVQTFVNQAAADSNEQAGEQNFRSVASVLREAGIAFAKAEALEGAQAGKLVQNLTSVLREAGIAFAKAEALIPEGRPRNARQWLVREMKPILETAGITVDDRPTGPFCQILEIVFEDAGEKPPPTDIRKLVQSVFGKFR